MTTLGQGDYGVVTSNGSYVEKSAINGGLCFLNKEAQRYEQMTTLQGTVIPCFLYYKERKLAIERVRGRTLEEAATDPLLTEEEWKDMLLSVVEVVDGLHTSGWCHTDLHCGNIMVSFHSGARIIDLASVERQADLDEEWWGRYTRLDRKMVKGSTLDVLHECGAPDWKVKLTNAIL